MSNITQLASDRLELGSGARRNDSASVFVERSFGWQRWRANCDRDRGQQHQRWGRRHGRSDDHGDDHGNDRKSEEL